MKHTKFIIACFIFSFFVCQSVLALSLVGNEANITPDPNARPDAYTENFAISGDMTVWIDYRDPNYVTRIYATLVDDPCHTEYLIDANAVNAWMVKADGTKIIYNVMDQMTEKALIRVAEVNDINNPVFEDFDVNVPYLWSLDVDGNTIAYSYDRDWYTWEPPGICVFSLADPNRTIYVVERIEEPFQMNSNIALDNNWLTWAGYFDGDKDVNAFNYLAVADITDPNNPTTNITALPGDDETWTSTSAEMIDASDKWLACWGSYLGQWGIYAIGNYYDANSYNWQFVPVFLPGGYNYDISTPSIDAPIVVWASQYYGGEYYTTNQSVLPDVLDRSPSYIGSQSLNGNYLMGAVLLDNGRAVPSILKENTDPNMSIRSAAIDNGEVVWSEEYYDANTYEYVTNLYNSGVQITCGDAGYSLADLNHDCEVDLKDFAMFAERWLDCTTYNGQGCGYGEVYPTIDGRWEVIY